jgi:hypothetical protein
MDVHGSTNIFLKTHHAPIRFCSLLLMTGQKPGLVTVSQSCETLNSPRWVSIHPFQRDDEKDDGLSAFIAERNEDTRAPAKLLFIVASHCTNVEPLQDLRQRHMFGRSRRQTRSYVDAVASHLSYPSIDVQSFLSVTESPPFEILAFQPHIIAQIAAVGASHFHFYLTRSEFNRVRDTGPPRFITSFTFDTTPRTSILICSRSLLFARLNHAPGSRLPVSGWQKYVT